MKDFLIFLPVTILFLSLKSTLLPGLPLPDIALIMVFYIAYARPSVGGVALSFVLGYVEDVFNGAVIGVTSFSFLFFFITVYVLARKVHFSTAAIKGVGAALGVLISGALSYYLLTAINPDLPFAGQVLPTALVTGLFAPVVILALERATGGSLKEKPEEVHGERLRR